MILIFNQYICECVWCLFTTDRPMFCTSTIGAKIMRLRGYRVKWLCADSRSQDCHSIVVTIGHTVVGRQNKHTHPPL
ncbi:hypothetical protein K1T71_006542 [Dendrolimus kikuchii]|uniref:Uncharacterized protein n=1 Tax=Dendrolimus kikuchii TaxID=765133 RepID=A0ACC1D1R2_9NEOP|nr:hypothetical protein K1T71_006542 [Dendrolimus kikuchii]